MKTITGIPSDPIEKEQWAIEIGANKHSLYSPYLAAWVLESIIDGSLASVALKQEAQAILESKKAGIIPNMPISLSDPLDWVYLIKASNGLHKIGITSNISHRLRTLRQMSPCALELVCTAKTASPDIIEAQLHANFASKRSHGEWFKLNSCDIAAIQQLFASVHIEA